MAEQGTNRSGLSWPRPRFSIRSLIWATTFVAMLFPTAWFAWFLLLNASTAWGAATHLGTAGILAIAALVAINRRGSTRAFWSGFAIIGLAYFLMVPYSSFDSPFDHEKLITTQIAHRAYIELIYPRLGTSLAPIGPGSPEHYADFISVAQLLWTLVLAICGGFASLLIWATGRPRQDSGGEHGRT